MAVMRPSRLGRHRRSRQGGQSRIVVGALGTVVVGGLWLVSHVANAHNEVTVTVDDVEVEESSGQATVEVSLDGALAEGERVVVAYATTPGTAEDDPRPVAVPRTTVPAPPPVNPDDPQVPEVEPPGPEDLIDEPDYDPAAGQLVFEPGGPSTQSFTVAVNDDDLDEGDEQITVQVRSAHLMATADASAVTSMTAPTLPAVPSAQVPDVDPTATTEPSIPDLPDPPNVPEPPDPPMPDVRVDGHPGEDTATVTILDDDGPDVSIAGTEPVAEGDEGDEEPVAAEFTVSLSAPSPQEVTVELATTDGPTEVTATNPDDYGDLDPATVTFEPGELDQTVVVPITSDDLDEGDEVFYVDLVSAEEASIAGGRGIGTIDDDDGPTVSVPPTSATEGTGGTTTVHVPIRLSAPSPQVVEVEFVTFDGTATAPADYQEIRDVLQIPAGAQTATVAVPVVADRTREPDEAFELGVYRATDAELPEEGVRGKVTVVDDDGPRSGPKGGKGGSKGRKSTAKPPKEDAAAAEAGEGHRSGRRGHAPADGYWLAGADGGMFAFGDAPFFGSLGDVPLAAPIVGSEATPSGDGYWLVAEDGGVFAFGDAVFHGSTGAITLHSPIVGMTATPSGDGYWLVASDGGMFAFGDAPFYGSTGGLVLEAPIVGAASTPDGDGYWLVASDGGVFTFGAAGYHGSTGGTPLAAPVVGLAPTSDGNGYWLVAQDGGVFAFGAPFHGSPVADDLAQDVVDLDPTPTGGGYWLTAADGGVFAFGNAPFHGAAAALPRSAPVVGLVPAPRR